MAEFKRIPPILVKGEFDENGAWIKFDEPECVLILEALGSDEKIHAIRMRMVSSLLYYQNFADQCWETMEWMLKRSMIQDGVWTE